MGIIRLSERDKEFLRSKAPLLNYDPDKGFIVGTLSFDLRYEALDETITDEYQIEIDLNNVSQSGVPVVRETGNRIVNIAKQKRMNPIDLHIGLDNTLCIIIPAKEKERYPNGFDLQELIKHIQEHLYWVSYYEKHDKAPWKAYGHGIEGYLELYSENKGLFMKYFDCHTRPEMRRKVKELRKANKK